MASLSSDVCSIPGCKRPVTCLCRHCQQDVCLKHFTEHQTEVNNELPSLIDRLNALHAKLQLQEDRFVPLIQLKEWRKMKYQEIDHEDNLKVEEFKEKISKEQEKVNEVNGKLDELVKEGDASHQQVQKMKDTLAQMEIQVNCLVTGQQINISTQESEPGQELIGTCILKNGCRFFVRGKVTCMTHDLYALESDKPCVGYNGKCPLCNDVHFSLADNRGFYTSVKTLLEWVNRKT